MTYSPERSSLRGIGASMVVVAHNAGYVSAVLLSGVAAGLFYSIGTLGWIGVALFLTLSIYLLMGRLDTGITVRSYFRSRIVRIWPLYFAFCFLAYLLIDRNVTHLLYNLAFLGTIFPNELFVSSYHWLPSGLIWTLQVEELAYLTFPLIARLSHVNRIRLAWALILADLIYVAIGIGITPDCYQAPYSWLVCYGAGLLAYEQHKHWTPIEKAIALGCLAAAIVYPTTGWPMGVIAVSPLAAWWVAEPPRFLRHLALVAIGECSYALYLLHVFWLEFFGIAGLPGAYLSAWFVEYAQRGRQMRGRLRQAQSIYAAEAK